MTMSEMRMLQLQDDVIAPVLTAKDDDQRPTEDHVRHYSRDTRRLFQMWDQLMMDNGVLVRLFASPTGIEPATKQLVAPKGIQQSILKSLHDGVCGGHLGLKKTLSKLKLRFYWPGHYRDVESWCRTCARCATRKTPTPHQIGNLQTVTMCTSMQMVAADLVGPFPSSLTGNKYTCSLQWTTSQMGRSISSA